MGKNKDLINFDQSQIVMARWLGQSVPKKHKKKSIILYISYVIYTTR